MTSSADAFAQHSFGAATSAARSRSGMSGAQPYVAASTSASVTGGKPSPAKTAWMARAAAPAHSQHLVLGDRLDPGIHLHVALGVSHSSRSSASKLPPPNVLSSRGITE